MMPKAWESARNAFEIEADALLSAFSRINENDFMRAAYALAKAERIAASGCGHSGIACMHFAHLMCCIERPARFISPSEALHGASGFLLSGDVMLIASRGGKTSELMSILEICKSRNVTTITVTENLDSPLAKNADIVLPINITRETDRDNQQGTTSFTVVSVLFDALQSAVLELTNFEKMDFSSIHPGGAVGIRLASEKNN